VKVFGEDFHTLDGIAQQIVRVVSSVRGAADPQMEITSGVAELSSRGPGGARQIRPSSG
jgi:cobalt-zinc-cadmium resistance protein CzcA